ncbi:hypothetical protein J3459_009852 [Metarhizium acridum]|nr:hypothetical protein J3459_009852 [Metarhizium acridum]
MMLDNTGLVGRCARMTVVPRGKRDERRDGDDETGSPGFAGLFFTSAAGGWLFGGGFVPFWRGATFWLNGLCSAGCENISWMLLRGSRCHVCGGYLALGLSGTWSRVEPM